MDKRIRYFRPNMVIRYPTAVKILEELMKSGAVEMEVFQVISCGEPLGASLRKYLEHVFQAKVVNIYGVSESLALGVETSREQGMYLFDDLNYIEAENGVMYSTSLYNFAQPLIRYRISDQLFLREPDERSAYPFTMAGSIMGRNEDLMWFEDGLLDYQFRQLNSRAFEMLAKVSGDERKNDIRTEMHTQMVKILQDKKLDHVTVTIYQSDFTVIMGTSGDGKSTLLYALSEMDQISTGQVVYKGKIIWQE